MAWTEAILRLQEVDGELKALEGRLADIATQLTDQREVLATRKEAEMRAVQAKKRQQAQKDLEYELGRVEAKRKQTQERLYSGNVRNPRELQDLQSESQALQRRQEQLEELLLEAMDAHEEASRMAAETQATYEIATQRGEQTQQALQSEREARQQQLQALRAENIKLQTLIPPDLLDSYRYLQRRMGATAIAQVNEGTCSVCGVATQLQIQRKVRDREEVYCDGCGRMLVG